MEVTELDNIPNPTSVRTSTVLVFLAAFAVMASWLGVYAVTNALVSADLMSGWAHEADPRPRWMLNTFLIVFGACAALATAFRFLSNRQLRRIDAMADAEE